MTTQAQELTEAPQAYGAGWHVARLGWAPDSPQRERSGGRVLPLVHPDRYVRIARSSPVRLEDNAVGTLYERWPSARRWRDALRACLS